MITVQQQKWILLAAWHHISIIDMVLVIPKARQQEQA